jgi:large subunit ribosomal protein L29
VTRVAELRELGEEELLERLESLKEELFNLRFQLATGQLDNPMRIKQVRHEVARILTLLRERDFEPELGEEPQEVVEEAPARSRRERRARAAAKAEAAQTEAAETEVVEPDAAETEAADPAEMEAEAEEPAEADDRVAEEES